MNNVRMNKMVVRSCSQIAGRKLHHGSPNA